MGHTIILCDTALNTLNMCINIFLLDTKLLELTFCSYNSVIILEIRKGENLKFSITSRFHFKGYWSHGILETALAETKSAGTSTRA